MNKLTDYEKQHELEWCPISVEILKEMYPVECDSQEDRDRKAETMPLDEFEIVFDATMQRYRKLKRKKEQQQQGDAETQEQPEEQEEKEVVAQ